MDILGKTTIVVIDTINLLQMMDTCGTLLYLIINISVATPIVKADIQSLPLSKFLVHNTGYTQEKNSTKFTAHKTTESINSDTNFGFYL